MPTTSSPLPALHESKPHRIPLPSLRVSDENIEREVYARLAVCPYLPIRQLDCECENGIVRLLGQVPTFYLKQVAQTLVRSVTGMQHLSNLVEVEDGPAGDGSWQRVSRTLN